jgi:hypothetical protein
MIGEMVKELGIVVSFMDPEETTLKTPSYLFLL